MFAIIYRTNRYISRRIMFFYIIDIGCEKPGLYGSNCEIPCPSNCRDSSCHIQNGTCIQCKPGWLGMYCDIGIII